MLIGYNSKPRLCTATVDDWMHGQLWTYTMCYIVPIYIMLFYLGTQQRFLCCICPKSKSLAGYSSMLIGYNSKPRLCTATVDDWMHGQLCFGDPWIYWNNLLCGESGLVGRHLRAPLSTDWATPTLATTQDNRWGVQATSKVSFLAVTWKFQKVSTAFDC
jgi:hypothetical protein